MKTTTSFAVAVALFALAINLGCFVENSIAQPISDYGHSHSGTCAGGCNHGGSNDSFGSDPYGQSGQAMMRQNYQSQQQSMYGRSGYAQQFQNSSPYRSAQRSAQPSAYQGDSGARYDRRSRGNNETRREEFSYANVTASRFASRSEHGHGSCHGSCRGGCSHHHRDHRGGGYDSQRYEGDARPSIDGGQPSRNEADQIPTLNMYRGDRDNQQASYGRTRSGQRMQMQPPYSNPRISAATARTSQEMYSPTAFPPTSLGSPNGSGSSECGHAGCNHSHN